MTDVTDDDLIGPNGRPQTDLVLLREILNELKEINQRDARMEDAMNKQREFSSTAVMEAMKSMGAVTGDNPSALNDIFRKMALDKEDDKGV